MKVLHVSPSFARSDGGPSETLRGLIPQLTLVGLKVQTLTTDKGFEARDRDFTDENTVTVVRSRRPRSWNFAPGMLRPLWRLAGWANVVHIHSINTFTTTAAMVICRIRRTPYLLEPHGAFDAYHMAQGATKKRLYNSTVDRYGLGGVNGLMTSSPRELQDASKIVPVRNFSLPLGVDPELFTVPRKHGPVPQILFLGRVAHKKRLDLLLMAIASPQLRSAPFHLTVAGPIGDDLDYSPAELADELGISQNVTFAGAVDRRRRMNLLGSSDVFVLPSEDESFGVAVAEAMAAGCAVIASEKVGIAPEASESDALILTDLDSEFLASRIAILLKSPLQARALGGRARVYAHSRFQWEISAHAAKDAYETAVRT